MASNSTFFESPQAAAVYKHRLLRSYVPAWAGKVGSRAPGKKVFIYDAYSGPGRYDDQAPGSPELVVDTAIAMARLRTVHSIFSDKEPAYVARLTDLLVEKGVPAETYEVPHTPASDSTSSGSLWHDRGCIYDTCVICDY